MTVIRVRCDTSIFLSITLHNFVTNTFRENGMFVIGQSRHEL